MQSVTLGAYVQLRRTQLNMTQEDLGERVGKSQRWVSNLEADGVQSLRGVTLTLMADALQVRPADLLMVEFTSINEAEAERLARITAAPYDPATRKGEIIDLINDIDWSEGHAQVEFVKDFLKGIRRRQRR